MTDRHYGEKSFLDYGDYKSYRLVKNRMSKIFTDHEFGALYSRFNCNHDYPPTPTGLHPWVYSWSPSPLPIPTLKQKVNQQIKRHGLQRLDI